MALIGEIRKRSWILIVMVGLGMGGFLMMDMLGRLGVSGLGNPNVLGSINGEKVMAQEFFAREQQLFANSQGDPFQNKDQVWDYFIQKKLLDEASGKLGLDVGDEEMEELFTVGPNFSQLIVQYFGGFQNFKADQYQQYKSQVENLVPENDQQQQALDGWNLLKEQVKLDRKLQKYSRLVSQSVYTPSWMAQMDNADQTAKVNFKFVGIPFASVGDADVTVTDGDIRKYIKENAYKYKREEETRKATYVVFDVVPTAADSLKIKDELAKLTIDFSVAEDDSLFISNNNGTFAAEYIKKDALSPIIADTLFDAPVGTVVGPYLEGRKYKLAKLVNRQIIPDSAQARHILIPVDNPEFNLDSMDKARDRAEGWKKLIESGQERFDSLAVKYSSDGSASKGGDLGWAAPGTYVPPFNEVVFYSGKLNKLYIVNTRFGVHLIEVLARKNSGVSGARIAYVTSDIVPSSQTINTVRSKAFEFVGKCKDLTTMDQLASEDPNLSSLTTPELKKSDYQILGLNGSTTSREMVKWLFDAKVGKVSSEIYTFQDPQLFYDNKFVVAAVASKQSKGLPNANDIKSEVDPIVRNQKKAEAIKAKLQAQGASDLNAIATEFQTSVQDASGVSFSQSFVQGMGNEPEVIGEIFNLELNKISAPIAGNTAVFVVQPDFKAEAEQITDFKAVKDRVSNNAKQQIQSGLFQAMKESAKIEDNRTKFY